MIPEGSNDEKLTDADSIGMHNFIRAYISQPHAVTASASVAALISWFIKDCSDTVEESVILGGSNHERLTDVDTRNC